MKNRKTWKFEGEGSSLNALERMYGEQGCKQSLYLLGKSLIMQSQKENDFLKAELALNWLLKAANLGHRDAFITLNACYRNNCGVSNNNRHLIEKCLRRTGKEIAAEIIGHALFITITDTFETEIPRSLAADRLTSILVDKQCNKENDNIVDTDKNMINEQYLINCVNDLFSFKNPELRLCGPFEKSDNKLNRLTNNACGISSDCLKIIPTFIVVETVQCLSKCVFYPLYCEEVDFNISLVHKMVVIAAFHVSMRIVYREQQFVNYRNWTELLTVFGESFGDEEKGKFYGGFKKAALFVIFLLFFAIYTKFIIVDEKDSTLTCLTVLSVVVSLSSFFRQFAFHKTFVTITLMLSLANAFLEAHLTRKGILLLETIDLIVFLVYLIKNRKQINRIHLYRVIFPLFLLKLWFQMSVNLLRDANDFKPLLSSVVPTFVTAATTPKLANIWIMVVLGTQLCFELEMLTLKTLISVSVLVVVYLMFVKTKWKLIAFLCAILSVGCIVSVSQHNGFEKADTDRISNWETIYDLCYQDNEMRSIEKCFNLRDNVVITGEAVVDSRRFVKHRNRMKQLINTIPWTLIRTKLKCVLGTIQQTDNELFNNCSLRNWDIYEFEVLATMTTTNTSLRFECTQSVQKIITEMEEGNVYNLIFKLTDIPSVTGRLLNATCSSCWRTTRPSFS